MYFSRACWCISFFLHSCYHIHSLPELSQKDAIFWTRFTNLNISATSNVQIFNIPPITWKSRLCVGRDIVQVNSKFSASYLSIFHQILFEGQKSNSNSSWKHKYMPATDLSNTSQFVCDKNHLCVVTLKKLFCEYGLEWFGRSISICHGWARNGAPPPIATTSFKHQPDEGRLTFDHLFIVNCLDHIDGLCYINGTPVFLNQCLCCDLFSNIGWSDDGRLCFSNSIHVNTCKLRTSDAQCRIGWWPALL